jgi:hypothetical protein
MTRYSNRICWAFCVSWLVPWTVTFAAEVVPILEARDVLRVGYISNALISESSGIVASRNQPGLFWTHNDKGHKPRLFAITQAGRSLATFDVEGTLIHDWEDIAIDDQGHLFLGDIGNNNTERSELAVYRIREPAVGSSRKQVAPEARWRLTYPGLRFDCESLFIYQNFGFVISKVFKDKKAEIYRFALGNSTNPVSLELVTRLPVTSPVTGADITSDGKVLGLVCKSSAYAFRIDGDLKNAGEVVPERTRFKGKHIEGCCFVPDGLLATSEDRTIYLFTNPAFRLGKP